MSNKTVTTTICELAKDWDNKRLIFEAHQMMNTPNDPEKRADAMAEMNVSEAEAMRAWNLLQKAKGEYADV